MGITQVTPGMSFSPATMTLRRSSKAAHMRSTASWGPFMASMPAHCTGAEGQELALICSRSASLIRFSGQ